MACSRLFWLVVVGVGVKMCGVQKRVVVVVTKPSSVFYRHEVVALFIDDPVLETRGI